MFRPAPLPIVLPRWAASTYTIDFVPGVDLTGTTWEMEVRDYPDAPGDPLVALEMAAPGSEGISLATRTEGGVIISTIRLRFNKSTMTGLRHWMASGREPGSPAELAYDIHGTGVVINGVSVNSGPIYEGSFTVKPGVKQ